MNKLLFLCLLFMAGCATVGGVTIYPDDTIVTVTTAFLVATALIIVKSYIEFLFNKALERYKLKLNKHKE